MILKTTDYDKFKFRDDNRARIDQGHVIKIAESIKARNLLEMRPILVNNAMEVLDGQHRLLAAKTLGLDIYYEVKKDVQEDDMLYLNMSKAWTMQDYLNYWVKKGNPDYIRLQNFMRETKLELKVLFMINRGFSGNGYDLFKNGTFVFNCDEWKDKLDIGMDTINHIKTMNGAVQTKFLYTAKFWMALVRLLSHSEFNVEKWQSNFRKFVERITIRATSRDYLKMMTEIYNWRNSNRIKFIEEEAFE